MPNFSSFKGRGRGGEGRERERKKTPNKVGRIEEEGFCGVCLSVRTPEAPT